MLHFTYYYKEYMDKMSLKFIKYILKYLYTNLEKKIVIYLSYIDIFHIITVKK